jgi:hypothetical protein
MTLTFRNLIVRARRRIHDSRDASALIITEYDKDGIRWTASNLAENVSESLIELSRDLVAYDVRGYINTGIRYTIALGKIAESGKVDLGELKFYDILRLEDTNKHVYSYVKASTFFSEDYKASLLDGTYVYTGSKAVDSDKMTYDVLPVPTADLNTKAICSVDQKTTFTTANEAELPFHGIDDLVLDYIERTCRLDEHDTQRVVELSAIIDKKLQVLKVNEGRYD